MSTEGRRERPRPFAQLWDAPGTPRPATTIANPLGGIAADGRALSAKEIAGAPGVDRWGGIDLSPDGREVVFAWDRSGALEIYAAPIFGDRIIQLTTAGARSVAPRWSPDGRFVSFLRGPADETPKVWVVDRDGEAERELVHGDPLDAQVTMSPDGMPRWSPDTASPVLAAARVEFATGSPRWSPDGSTIAFATFPRQTSKIAFADVRDGAVTRVEVLGRDTPFEDSGPVWRPDGRGVVYRRREHGNVTLHRVFTISHADDAVIDVPGWLFSPQVAPDSETVVAVLVDRRGSDLVVRLKGGIAIARLTSSVYGDRTPAPRGPHAIAR